MESSNFVRQIGKAFIVIDDIFLYKESILDSFLDSILDSLFYWSIKSIRSVF